MGHHPGDVAVQAVSGGATSPLSWLIIMAVLAAGVYFAYWIFSE